MKSSGQTRLPTGELGAQRADRADREHAVAALLRPAAAGWRRGRSRAGGRWTPSPWRCSDRGAVLGRGSGDRLAARPQRVAAENHRQPSHRRRSYAAVPVVAYGGRVADRPSGREESEGERLDRNLGELLQELRVALPGVQVLFAFLLAVPFQQNFTEISPFEKKVYFATLLCTALSAVLLIAPSAYHRMTFRLQQKHQPRLPRQPLRDRRPLLPGAGDDGGDRADHRRALRRRRDRRHRRRGAASIFAPALVPAAAAPAAQSGEERAALQPIARRGRPARRPIHR